MIIEIMLDSMTSFWKTSYVYEETDITLIVDHA